jgi:hypothetical protein
MSPAAFCQGLGTTLSQIQAQGDEAQLAASVSLLVEQLKGPPKSEYLGLDSLGLKTGKSSASLALSPLLGQTLGLRRETILIFTPSDLKFIPFTMEHRDLILLAKDSGELNADRISKVVKAATGRDLGISVIWLGLASQAEEATRLQGLAETTGGKFVDLSQVAQACQLSPKVSVSAAQ